MSRYVLGVSMSNHDRSACLLRDGEIAGAIAEERLDRRKRSEGFYRAAPRGVVLPPMRAISALLRDNCVTLDGIELIVCGRSMTSCRDQFLAYLPVDPARVVEPPPPSHHIAHGYSAFATSPYESTAVLVIDEQGQWIGDEFERCTWFESRNGKLRPIQRFRGSATNLSIGMFYNVFAALTGLAEGGRPAPGKLMSLAGIGNVRHEWPELMTLSGNGDAGCDLRVLDEFLGEIAGVPYRPGMNNIIIENLDELLRKYHPVGWQGQLGADLARKAQDELERAVLHTAGALRQRTDADALAYAGGVALNCSANVRLAEAGWRQVHVHPAATDDGAAVGLALYGWLDVLDMRATHRTAIFDPRTGRAYSSGDVTNALSSYGMKNYARGNAPVDQVADRIVAGRIVCWFAGRSEWGPRALGARSIVANPLEPGITARINRSVKFREPFRPFGISVLSEAADDLLDRRHSPEGLDNYMLGLAQARHPALAAIAHVDGTIRHQLVDQDAQPEWYALIQEVGDRTGFPAVLNTSFNTLGEPLVETPEDAVRQFLLAGADALWIEGDLVVATDVPSDVWTSARTDAWNRSSLDPVSVANALLAADYPDSAKAILDEFGSDDDAAVRLGHDHARQYRLLRMLLAEKDKEFELASGLATAVLDSWLVPPEVLDAARLLAAHNSGTVDGKIGTLLTSLATNQSGLALFRTLMGAGNRNGARQMDFGVTS
jgi:carbamoyltransferase